MATKLPPTPRQRTKGQTDWPNEQVSKCVRIWVYGRPKCVSERVNGRNIAHNCVQPFGMSSVVDNTYNSVVAGLFLSTKRTLSACVWEWSFPLSHWFVTLKLILLSSLTETECSFPRGTATLNLFHLVCTRIATSNATSLAQWWSGRDLQSGIQLNPAQRSHVIEKIKYIQYMRTKFHPLAHKHTKAATQYGKKINHMQPGGSITEMWLQLCESHYVIFA